MAVLRDMTMFNIGDIVKHPFGWQGLLLERPKGRFQVAKMFVMESPNPIFCRAGNVMTVTIDDKWIMVVKGDENP